MNFENAAKSTSTNNSAETARGSSVTAMLVAAAYLRRRALLLIWGLSFVTFFAVAMLVEKRYTSSVTIQVKGEESAPGLGLGEGLKMLSGGLGKGSGTGTIFAVLESRQLAMTMIENFDLKNRYRTKWDHLAIKKFKKNFSSDEFDDEILQISFTHPSRDTAKLILDSILAYTNRRVAEYSSSKARLEFMFNERQVDSIYRRMDSLSDSWTSFMRKAGIAELKSNVELALRSYGAIEEALTLLEEKRALARVDNRVSPQDRKNIESQINALEERRRRLLAGAENAGTRAAGDYNLSIAYDSIPGMLAWQQKLEFLAEKDQILLKFLLPKLEQSRLKMVETTPVINIIDPSFIPPYKSGPKRGLIVVAGTLFSGTLLSLLLIFWEWFRNPAFGFPMMRGLFDHVRRFR
jgi:tyrosine-protein kinase Etk/Wzc